MPIPYLPPEIITTIFLTLDLKTLSIVRFVNKSWFRFISSPNFATAHLKNSKKDESLSGHSVLFSTCNYFNCKLKQFSIPSLLCNSSSPINVTTLVSNVGLAGSCNGLVCIASTDRDIILWNPCTGKYKNLRPLDIGKGRLGSVCYGFGYDESIDDYKVVVLRYFDDEIRNGVKDFRYVVKVNSLKKNYWKRVRDFEGRISGSGKVASGKIHWVEGGELVNDVRRDIISFDLGSEVFGIVEQPSHDEDGCLEMTMGVLEGCICMLRTNRRTHAYLWVMKEYGVKESWTKVVTISCLDDLVKSTWLRPCFMLPNGEILFATLKSFAVYNPEDDSFRVTDIHKFFLSEPVVHVQSLVSPVGTRRRGTKKAKLVEYLPQYMYESYSESESD